jgi:hypothetical protein
MYTADATELFVSPDFAASASKVSLAETATGLE